MRQSIDPRGASYTPNQGDMRVYNGTSAARQHGNNTRLITPHIFHAGNVGVHHATATNAHGTLSSIKTAELVDNGEGLSCSFFTGSDFSNVASVGSGIGNVCMRGSEDILEITPQFSTLMQANECSNSLTLSIANEWSSSSTLSLDLTPPEITDVRDAVLMEIMTSFDTDRVVELGEIDEGLRRP